MIGATGSVGRTAQGKHDDANGPATRAKDVVVGGCDAIRIVEEIAGVVKPRPAERRIHEHGHPTAGTGPDEPRRASIAGPSRWTLAMAPSADLRGSSSPCLYGVIHC